MKVLAAILIIVILITALFGKLGIVRYNSNGSAPDTTWYSVTGNIYFPWERKEKQNAYN